MERALGSEASLHAPHLLGIEVAHALRRLVQQDVITNERAEQMLQDSSRFLIERHEHQPLTARI